jgi:hypothetical protein
MKCPNCGNEMVESRAGHLCLSCGHVEASTGPSTDAGIATGKDGHDQSRAAAATHAATSSKPEEPATSDKAKADKPEEPAKPEEPTQPEEPAEPEKPAKPKEPAKSEESDTPDLDEDEKSITVDETKPDKSEEHEESEEPDKPDSDKGEEPAKDETSAPGTPPSPPSAPWEAPAPDTPKSDEPATASTSESAPNSDDLSAIEKVVAEVEQTKPADEADDATKSKEPAADQSKSEEPAGDESKSDEPVDSPEEPVAEPADEPPEDPKDHPGESESQFEPAHDQPDPEPPASDPLPPAVADTVPAAALPLNGKPPLTPVTHPRPLSAGRSLKIAALLVAALVVLGGAGAAAYLYLASPKSILSNYLQGMVVTKTSTFAADITSSSAADGYRFALKLDGKNDLTDASKPKLDVGVTGQLSVNSGVVVPAGSSTSGSLSGHVVVTNQVLYFKIISLSVLSDLLPIKISDDWYKYDLASTDTGKCLNKGKSSGSYLGNPVLTQIPVKNAAFLGFSTINGTRMLHYRGTIDNSKLKAAIDKANEKLSADCRLDISADDFKNVSVTYELWHGLSKDRLKVSVVDSSAKTNSEITLDSSGYNKPVKIDAPSSAKDVSQLLSDLTQVKGAATGPTKPAATPMPTPTPSPAPAPDTSDATRKANLAGYLAAYQAKAKNGFFPTNPPAVSVNAPAPTTRPPYTVIKATPTALGQIEYRPGGACQGPATTPGKTGTRYLALYTLLADGHTLACADNR